ncbi:MAG TPA: response regulator, partial [Cellvibrionaceae bacterium]
LVEFEENQIILKVTVSDEGIGLDEETQKILFGGFTQADASPSRKHTGTGLGLAICKGLVQRMQGEIGVNSVPGQGTSFWFTVRMDVDSHYTALEQNALQDKKLLICAENQINYLQLQSLTESWQASTLWIETIHELFPTLRKQQQSGQPCHLLILDIAPEERKLPPRLLSNIAEQLENEFSCKMIVCCTPAHMQLFQHHNTERPLSFVKKPITQNELLGAINTNLDIQSGTSVYQPTSSTTKASTLKKVLVVDDNKANLQLASELLKGLKIETIQALSGTEALKLFSEDSFDAVFMDIQMPGMDGLETTRRLRLLDQEHNKRTPIIALTAHSLTDQKTDLLLAGFDDCLKKPVDEAQFTHVLNRWTGFDTLRTPLPRTTVKAGNPNQNGTYQPVSVEQCLSLANYKPVLARDMLVMLIEGLTDDKRAIRESFTKQDYRQLQEHIHRLYGSSCYCGVPILRSLAGLLDKILQAGQYHNVAQAIDSIEKAIDDILHWAEKYDTNTIFTESKPALVD